MKKLILLSTLALLAACGAVRDDRTASQICAERGLTKGTPEYAHCMVDERKAEDLSRENKARIGK